MLATEFPEVLPAEAAPELWERQHNESPKQFWYFSEYRSLHPLERSLAEVGRSSGVSVSFLERLSSRHRWVNRAAEWDLEQDKRRQVRLLSRMEAMEKRHLQIAETALTKISQRLEDLDPADVQVQHIPRLLEAVIRIQELLFPPPTETPQPGRLLGATEIRRELKRMGMLTAPAAPPAATIRPDLQAWIDGTLDDPNAPA